MRILLNIPMELSVKGEDIKKEYTEILYNLDKQISSFEWYSDPVIRIDEIEFKEEVNTRDVTPVGKICKGNSFISVEAFKERNPKPNQSIPSGYTLTIFEPFRKQVTIDLFDDDHVERELEDRGFSKDTIDEVLKLIIK